MTNGLTCPLSTSGAELAWCGERFVLLPDRAVWWPAQRTLFIADPHFGKAATFRAAAVPIPDGTAADLARLTRLLEQTAATTLVVLGDLLHARQGRCPQTFAQVSAWRNSHAHVKMQLIIGNHDRRAGLPPEDWRLECLPEPGRFGSFQLRHYPQFDKQPALAGHLHPKFRLTSGRDRVITAGFLLREETLVLPAFSSFVDSQVIDRQPGDTCFAIAGDEICRLDSPGAR